MCVGLPMQVIESAPGQTLPAGWVRVAGRGEERAVDTALVGACAPGEWVLVFLDRVQERLDARRAAEIDATLDLVAGAMRGLLPVDAAAAFALPSAMDAAALAALIGAPAPALPPRSATTSTTSTNTEPPR
jgi:hydrogenase expression/formation protein HypC